MNVIAKNPFRNVGDGETCPIGYEITTVDRCGEVLKHDASIFGTTASSVNNVTLNNIPNQCVIRNSNRNIVFSNHPESNNQRWIKNEYSMICEAGKFLLITVKYIPFSFNIISSIIRLYDSTIF